MKPFCTKSNHIYPKINRQKIAFYLKMSKYFGEARLPFTLTIKVKCRDDHEYMGFTITVLKHTC